jgi:hypothetical protein
MRRVLIVVVTIIAALSFTGWADAETVTITFDEYSPIGSDWLDRELGFIYDEYADQGVYFTQIDPADPDGTTYSGGVWSITGTNLPNFYGMNGWSRGIILDFNSEVTSISFDYRKAGLVRPEEISYWIYDDGVEIGSGGVSITEDWQTFEFDSLPFDSIKLQMLGGQMLQDRWAMDDLTYDINAVPVPASILMLGTGLAGLVGMRRKR